MKKENNQPRDVAGDTQQPLFSAPTSLLFQAPELGKPNVSKIATTAADKTGSIPASRRASVQASAEITFAAPKVSEPSSTDPKTGGKIRKKAAAAEIDKVLKQDPASNKQANEASEPVEAVSFQAPPTVKEAIGEDWEKPSRIRKKKTEAEVLETEFKTKKRRLQSSRQVETEEEASGYESVEEIDDEDSSRRRRRRRSRTATKTREESDEITVLKGSTRLEAKKLRRREGRKEGRRQKAITEAEFLARRESVKRKMLIRSRDGLNQIAILEDNVLVEHYVSRHTQTTMVGSVFLGRVQNVLPSMEAAFVDLGKGRNAVLYAGEVNWDAAGLQGTPRRIEQALKAGDKVPVQVTKDPIGHKGARLTSQITLPGRYLVLVPGGAMTGISRKLPEVERRRLKQILRKIVPNDCGVIIRTAAEGASEEQLKADVQRLCKQWEEIEQRIKTEKNAPSLLYSEPELSLRVVRDIFNEDFEQLLVQGKDSYLQIKAYVERFAPDLIDRLEQWVDTADIFVANRIDEQLAKGMDRKVWLPSGGYLIIDRTEAMTVIDVNTGKYTGSGGTLEETITRNNLEAAEEIMRQLRLRDIGGIIVIDFVDMVLESNRDLVLRRLIECLGRDRTRHQVTEVTSLGLVQMTRKRVGEGLVEAFSTVCDCCDGKGFIVHSSPVERNSAGGVKEEKAGRNKARARETGAKKLNEQAAKSIAQVAAATKQEGENPLEKAVEQSSETPNSLQTSADKDTKTAEESAPAVEISVKDTGKTTRRRRASSGQAANPKGDTDTQEDAERRRREAAKSVAEALSVAAQMLEIGQGENGGAAQEEKKNKTENKSKNGRLKAKRKTGENPAAEKANLPQKDFSSSLNRSVKTMVEKPKRKKHAAVALPVVDTGTKD